MNSNLPAGLSQHDLDRSDEARAEFIQRKQEYLAEKRREEDIFQGKTGSDFGKFLDKHPMAEFKDNE